MISSETIQIESIGFEPVDLVKIRSEHFYRWNVPLGFIELDNRAFDYLRCHDVWIQIIDFAINDNDKKTNIVARLFGVPCYLKKELEHFDATLGVLKIYGHWKKRPPVVVTFNLFEHEVQK